MKQFKNTYVFHFMSEEDGEVDREFKHEIVTNGEDYAEEVVDQFLLYLSSVFGYSITREWLANRGDVNPETTTADVLAMGGMGGTDD